MGEGHVPHAEPVEHPQRPERVLDRVTTLDADQAGESPRGEVALHVRRGVRHRHGAWVFGAQAMDQIDLLQRVHGGMNPRIHRRHGHVGGPELPGQPAGADLREIGHQGGLQHGEVHRVDPAARPDRVGDVVVAVDQRRGAQNAQGLGAEILGGKTPGRQQCQNQHQSKPAWHRSIRSGEQETCRRLSR